MSKRWNHPQNHPSGNHPQNHPTTDHETRGIAVRTTTRNHPEPPSSPRGWFLYWNHPGPTPRRQRTVSTRTTPASTPRTTILATAPTDTP